MMLLNEGEDELNLEQYQKDASKIKDIIEQINKTNTFLNRQIDHYDSINRDKKDNLRSQIATNVKKSQQCTELLNSLLIKYQKDEKYKESAKEVFNSCAKLLEEQIEKAKLISLQFIKIDRKVQTESFEENEKESLLNPQQPASEDVEMDQNKQPNIMPDINDDQKHKLKDIHSELLKINNMCEILKKLADEQSSSVTSINVNIQHAKDNTFKGRSEVQKSKKATPNLKLRIIIMTICILLLGALYYSISWTNESN